jgi:hypothetical protein
MKKHYKSSVFGLTVMGFAAFVAGALMTGCPSKVPADVISAVQRASATQQSLDLIYREALDSITGAVQDATAEKIVLSRDISRDVDFDADTGSGDVAPNATGTMQVTGTAELDTALTTGTISVQNLLAAFVSDVSVTDPTTEMTSTFSQGGALTFSATGTYAITLLLPFSSETHLVTTVEDLMVVTQKTEEEARDVLWNATIDITSHYEDAVLIDGLPGTRLLDVDISSTAEWVEGETSNTVELHLVIAGSTGATTETLTITVNNAAYGPYTLEEFSDIFGATMGAFGG